MNKEQDKQGKCKAKETRQGKWDVLYEKVTCNAWKITAYGTTME
jgi:hypothetical protein